MTFSIISVAVKYPLRVYTFVRWISDVLFTDVQTLYFEMVIQIIDSILYECSIHIYFT